jgi:serpin B
VIVNAIYFKGAWATGFDPSQTGMQPFTLSDGTQVSVTTMAGTIPLRAAFSETLTVVELPYRGGALVMDFLLPTSPGALAAFEAAFTPTILSEALWSASPKGRPSKRDRSITRRVCPNGKTSLHNRGSSCRRFH